MKKTLQLFEADEGHEVSDVVLRTFRGGWPILRDRVLPEHAHVDNDAEEYAQFVRCGLYPLARSLSCAKSVNTGSEKKSVKIVNGDSSLSSRSARGRLVCAEHTVFWCLKTSLKSGTAGSSVGSRATFLPALFAFARAKDAGGHLLFRQLLSFRWWLFIIFGIILTGNLSSSANDRKRQLLCLLGSECASTLTIRNVKGT